MQEVLMKKSTTKSDEDLRNDKDRVGDVKY